MRVARNYEARRVAKSDSRLVRWLPSTEERAALPPDKQRCLRQLEQEDQLEREQLSRSGLRSGLENREISATAEPDLDGRTVHGLSTGCRPDTRCCLRLIARNPQI